jgi:hypothetical protein
LVILSSSSIKITILLFYKRLSAPFTSAFRIATGIGILFHVGYAVSQCMVMFLICRPYDSYWNQFSLVWLTQGHKWHCAREDISLPISGVLSVIGDLYSTVLPLLLVSHLQMNFRKKLALFALFALGFL